MDGRRRTDAVFGTDFEQHRTEAFRTALSVLHDRDLAEDVAQDVFFRLWEAGGHDPGRGSVTAYVRMMARSRAIDVWRTRRARERMQDRLEHQHDDREVDSPVVLIAEAELRTAARAAVRGLPPEQRAAIVAAYWGERSASQIAAAERIPLGTAKGRLRLGLARLRREAELAAAA